MSKHPSQVICPRCKAKVGEPCFDGNYYRQQVHIEREIEADKA